MTRRTRYFVFGSIGLLIIGLCTGMVAYYAGAPGFGARGQAPAALPDLQYVPEDAALVAYANVQDIMNSEVRSRLRAMEPHGGRGHDEFRERTGIDVETDIDQVVAYMPAGPTLGRGEPGFHGVVVLRGRFDAVRLEGLARERGGEVGEHRGRRTVGHGEGLLAFAEPGVILLGEAAAVRRSLDVQAGGRAITANAEAMAQMEDIWSGANTWVVGRFADVAHHAPLPPGVAEQMPSVQWFTAYGRVNGGVEGLLQAQTRDEEAAQNLRDVVRGFLALARLQAGGRPEYAALLQSLELGGAGRTVALSFTVPATVLDLLTAPRSRGQ